MTLYESHFSESLAALPSALHCSTPRVYCSLASILSYSSDARAQLLVNVYRADAALLPAAASGSAARRDGGTPASSSPTGCATLGGYFDERLLFHILPTDHSCAAPLRHLHLCTTVLYSTALAFPSTS